MCVLKEIEGGLLPRSLQRLNEKESVGEGARRERREACQPLATSTTHTHTVSSLVSLMQFPLGWVAAQSLAWDQWKCSDTRQNREIDGSDVKNSASKWLSFGVGKKLYVFPYPYRRNRV